MIVMGRTLAAAAATLTLAAAPASAGARLAGTPAIRAHPREVMVDSATMLRGSGFPARETIQLRECGRTSWNLPEDPCDAEDVLDVTTDARGAFTASFHVQLCPEGEPGREPTERVCYVGEPVAGEGTARLVGAARIRVSYP